MSSLPCSRSISRSLAYVVVTAAAAVLAGCPASSGDQSQSSTKRPRIVVTVPMLADLVEAVAGEEAIVERLLGPGVDPHLYKPTTSDIVACDEAEAVFYVGLRLEGALADDLTKLAVSKKRVVAVGEAIAPDRLIRVGGHSDASSGVAGEVDPHLWMDVSLWAETVPTIVETLAELRPEARGTFEANAGTLAERLQRLHLYAAQTIATIPEKRRVLITSHDAFSYFGRAYDLQVEAVQGVSTESEAGVQDIERLVGVIGDTGVQTVFTETSTANKQVEALVEAARAEGLEVATAEADLFSDSTGPVDTWEGTYAGMIDHDVNLITRSLGGIVPEGGFRGDE